MTLTDDDLGARLRTALQGISPLATDPVPPPRFVPTVAQTYELDDVLVLDDLVARGPRSRRPVAVAAGLLAVAAAVTATLVALIPRTDVRSGTAATVSPDSFASAPPTGAGDGLFVYPDVVRCTVPTGTTLSASHVTSPDHLDIWTVAAGASCRAMPLERGRYLFDPPRARDPADTPVHVEGSTACLIASTGAMPFVSRGAGDYLEFFGPSCLIRSSPR